MRGRSSALSSVYLGELSLACRHFERSLTLYDSSRHKAIALYGAILNRAHLGRTLVYLGYHDRGRMSMQDAVKAADEIRHPIGLVNTLSVAAFVEVFYRRMPETLEITERMILLADDHGYPYYRAIGLIMRGLAQARLEGGEDGIGLMRQGLAAHRTAETWQNHATYLILLAEALGETGRTDEALATLEDAQAAIVRTGERYYEAELYHLKGKMLLKRSDDAAPSGAEACFSRAVDIARRQGAKSWELRASMSLARLWHRQGKRAEAARMLAEIYGWFTEGFDTADLRDAKALLNELITVRQDP